MAWGRFSASLFMHLTYIEFSLSTRSRGPLGSYQTRYRKDKARKILDGKKLDSCRKQKSLSSTVGVG